MRKFAVTLLTIMFIAAGCAAGIVKDDKVVGVAAGQSELSSCDQSQDPNSADCKSIEGGQLSEAVANALSSAVGAVSSIVSGARGVIGSIFGGLFGGSDDEDSSD